MAKSSKCVCRSIWLMRSLFVCRSVDFHSCKMANLWNTHCPAKNCFRVWLEIVCGRTTRTKKCPLPICVILPYFHSIHCTYSVFRFFHFRFIFLSILLTPFHFLFLSLLTFSSVIFLSFSVSAYSPILLHHLLPSGLLHSTLRSLFVRCFFFLC